MPNDPITGNEINIPGSWRDGNPGQASPGDGFKKKIIILLSLISFLLIGLVATLYFLENRAQTPSVEIQFSQSGKISAGRPFPLAVSIANLSVNTLKDARVSLSLPDGVYFAEESPDTRFLERDIEEVNPGSIAQESFLLVSTGDPGTIKNISAKLIYDVENSKSQFEKISDHDISIDQASASLEFAIPANTFSGEVFSLKVKYANVSQNPFDALRLRIDYPAGFQFQSASPAPKKGNNEWEFGKIDPGAESFITITGKIVGPDNGFYNFDGLLQAPFSGQIYAVGTQSAGISISAAPLSVIVSANSNTGYVARIGDTIRYEIQYRNNSNIPMTGVSISLKVRSQLFDFSTTRTKGVFDSLNNIFSWNAANEPGLSVLQPGQSGKLEVGIRLKQSYQQPPGKDHIIAAEAHIESPTVPQGTSAQKTFSDFKLETKVAGDFGIYAKGFWRDADSGIENGGSYPPRVNRPTQYTIHWQLENYATDKKNIHISAFLQSGTVWTGRIKSTLDAKPVYNPNTQEVTWDIPFLPANTGISATPVEAVFQVENTPALTQAGQYITLIDRTNFTAEDSFANVKLTGSDEKIATDLPDDKSLGNDRQVKK